MNPTTPRPLRIGTEVPAQRGHLSVAPESGAGAWLTHDDEDDARRGSRGSPLRREALLQQLGHYQGDCPRYLPGDELLDRPVVRTTEAVWINAPANAVWPWLVQMGQDRGGLYSDETLENLVGLNYHNADRIHPEWQRLAPGDRVRLAPRGWMGLRDGLALTVAEAVEEQAVMLCAGPPAHPLDAVWSFHVVPYWEDRCRLLVRSRTRRRHWADAVAVECAAPAKALVTWGASWHQAARRRPLKQR